MNFYDKTRPWALLSQKILLQHLHPLKRHGVVSLRLLRVDSVVVRQRTLVYFL